MAQSEEEQPTFDFLLSAAQAGQWDYVDSHLSRMIVEDPLLLDWATSAGLYSAGENLRDLAASTLGRSGSDPLTVKVARKLTELMNTDSGRYVQFRAACALHQHGDRSSAVMTRIREFVNDPDVGTIAQLRLEA